MAMIRYFCVAGTGPAGHLSFEYLIALSNSGRHMRAQTIGVAQFVERWAFGSHLFATELRSDYVNVVCAPFGHMMGSRITSSQMARADNCPPELRAILSEGTREEFVYEPQTALCGLYTVGCSNIAIVSCQGKEPDAKEIAHLNRYDAVICPTVLDVTLLEALGVVNVTYVPPKAELIIELLGDVCGFAITATSEATQGMPELPTIISSLSQRKQTSSSRLSRSVSRSRTLQRRSRLRNGSLRSRGSRSFLTRIGRMWRSITRHLGRFLRRTGRKTRRPKK